MGIKLAKKNNQYNMQRRTFYIDSADDLDTIETEYDCGIGDLAELPDGTTYCRHSDGYDGDLWEKRGSGRSPGGGGSGSSGTMVVHDVEGILDKTWQEIYDAFSSGTLVLLFTSFKDEEQDSTTLLILFYTNLETIDHTTCILQFTALDPNGGTYGLRYYADSADGYPVLDE